MGKRIDYLNDPSAPAANSIVPSVNVAVTDDDGRLLVIRRTDNGNWALPGGGIDVGESLADAAVREVEEETGIAARSSAWSASTPTPGTSSTTRATTRSARSSRSF